MIRKVFCTGFSFLMLIFVAFTQKSFAQVVINEICSANVSVLEDDDGDYSDWIEIYNTTSADIGLSGYFLSDDLNNPFKFLISDAVVPGNGYLLIWASEKNQISLTGDVHTNFKLAGEGEPLILVDANGNIIDQMDAVSLGANMSYGRQIDGMDDFVFYTSPTPWQSNNSAPGFEEYMSVPELMSPTGFYTAPFSLFIFHNDPNAELRYTINGEEPTMASPLYENPLPIDNTINSPSGISAIPTTPSNVPEWYRWFAPIGTVYKGTSVRVKAFKSGAIPSQTSSGFYLVDPDGEEKYDLPMVSLTIPEDGLFGFSGIYTNYLESGINWERKAHMELFAANGFPVFSSNIGLRVHGGNSRRYALKSFRIYFRGTMGADALNYPIFSGEEDQIHERLILRNSGSDWALAYFRDAFVQQILNGYSTVDFMRYQPAVSFVNGEYWGILNFRDRLDDHYIKNKYGYGEGAIDLLENTHTAIKGNANHYEALRSYWQNNNLNEDVHYNYVKTQMDVDNFRDYHILQIYSMNTDQPGKNVRFWRPRTPDGKWKWMFFDMDDSFHRGSYCNYDRDGLVFCTGLNSISSTTVNSASNSPTWAPNGPLQTLPLRSLLQSETFRLNFINRFADLLNSAFLPARIEQMINQFDVGISPYMEEHYLRWHRPVPETRNEQLQTLRDFGTNRKAYIEDDIVEFFELDGSYELGVNVSPPLAGQIKINSIYIHPDSIFIENESIYPWVGTYYQGLQLPVVAFANSGFAFSHWLETGETNDTIWLEPTANTERTAVFTEIPTAEPIHYWSFNAENLPQPHYTIGGGNLGIEAGTMSSYEYANSALFTGENSRLGAPAGTHLRVNNPIGSTLTFDISTQNYTAPHISYEANRSGQGAGRHWILLSTDGVEYQMVDSFEVYEDSPTVFHSDLSVYAGTTNNADLRIRLVVREGEGGIAGNNRIDNFAVDATPFTGNNFPPGLSEMPERLELIAGNSPEIINLSNLFSDPEGDVILFEITETRGSTADAAINSPILEITPVASGNFTVSISIKDEFNAPSSFTFDVLVHPSPVAISTNQFFQFQSWSGDVPESIYPPHMLFLQGQTPDPDLHNNLTHAYEIPDNDYHVDDILNIGFPYNNTRRTRINGLGEGGISFVNTGRNRDLGGAVAAVSTVGLNEALYVTWKAGTVMPLSKLYHIRLQYRFGIESDFSDLIINGEPVEYAVNAVGNHNQFFASQELPGSFLNRPYIQFMWRYYFTGLEINPDDGARSVLRLDDLLIGTGNITGVYEDQARIWVGLFPNPTSSVVTIQNPVPESLTASFYNIGGRLSMRQIIPTGSSVIPVHHLAGGLYVIAFTHADGSFADRKKLVILK